MLRIAFIVLPFFAPLIVYALYRRLRYAKLAEKPKPVFIGWLLLLGLVLAGLNILLFVEFNAVPAGDLYQYPDFAFK